MNNELGYTRFRRHPPVTHVCYSGRKNMSVNRRIFLLGSAVAAHAFQSEKTVGTASIGVGNRGSFLLQGVLRQPNAKLVALCDIKPDRLDKAATAAARDNPSTSTDWRRVIENKDVDAV